MSENLQARLGRPPKDEDEKLDHYVYVRLRRDQDDLVREIARREGFAENGGRSAAVRWALERIRPLIEKKPAK